MTYEAFPILYVKSDCPRCADVVSFLDEHGIAYRLRDISADPGAAGELQRFSDHSLVPTLDWHGEILAGLSPDRLAAFLKEQEVELEDS